jgi:hypothetical protein
MEQNQVIILVVLLAVIAVAVVAVVFLMGDSGETTMPTADEEEESETPVPGPVMPSSNSINCDISASGKVESLDPATGTMSEVDSSMEGSLKIKKPDMLNMEASGIQGSQSMTITMIINGDTVYMYAPELFGGLVPGMDEDSWIETSISEMSSLGTDMSMLEEVMGMTAEEVEAEMSQSPEAMMASGMETSVQCSEVAELPDSEFQLPPGATAKTMQDMQDDIMNAVSECMGTNCSADADCETEACAMLGGAVCNTTTSSCVPSI